MLLACLLLLGCHGLLSHDMCWVFSARKWKNCAIVPKMPCTVWQNILLKAWVFRSSSLLARANGLAPQQRFVRFQEAFSVGMLVTIAVSVFLSTFKLLSSAPTVRSWPTLKEVIERFGKIRFTKSKRTSKQNQRTPKKHQKTIQTQKWTCLFYESIFECFSNVLRAQDKCLTARPRQRNWLASTVHETRIYFTVSWWISILFVLSYVLTSLIPQLYFVTVPHFVTCCNLVRCKLRFSLVYIK